MELDLTEWLTLAQAAAKLGVSERTLERMNSKGTGPERRFRPRRGNRPEPVYSPADVDRLAAELSPPVTPSVVEMEVASPAPTPAAVARVSPALDLVVSAMQTLAERLGPARLPAFLTIKEASAYSGLSQAFLKRLVRAGTLPAVLDGAIKVRRVDLDNLANSDTISPMAKLAESGGAS